MDIEQLDDLAEIMADEVGEDIHAMINEMAERVLANYLECNPDADLDYDDQMHIVSYIEANWTYHV